MLGVKIGLNSTGHAKLGTRPAPTIEQVTPCMTAWNAPYGELVTSNFLTNYNPYKGMNCSAANVSDAWLTETSYTPADEKGAWFRWRNPGGELWTPTSIRMQPRNIDNADWSRGNNPYEIRVYGILDYDVDWDNPIFERVPVDSIWDNKNMREWKVDNGGTYNGFIVFIKNYIYATGQATTMHTGFARFEILGIKH